ncbi:DUF883 family protein [Rhizobium sp. Pop5]|uniref:glycine zipper domain-containing protein n=1 Tax=Rhizobium sp. Pop5 TaxID=1223565 RepID=UPI000283D4AB|nr:DUF883 family protein [Rhizobium sp. Pop5]EJZ17712.1 transmembrane protein [Rhizobium sp. Pop5]UVD55815.1 DUF883 family protein [Rhizobium sp. Pop5]
MTYSIFHSGRSRRNGTFQNFESGIEEQIEALRDELAELTRLVGKSSRHQGDKIRSQASTGYEELLGRSEDLLRELQHGYERSATEMRETVRKHPLATIGAAAAVGLAIAFLARR